MKTDKEKLEFLEWAEKTHPAYLNNLKSGYKRYTEMKKCLGCSRQGEQKTITTQVKWFDDPNQTKLPIRP